MFQESEIINLLIGLVGLGIIVRFLKNDDFPGTKYLKAGFIVMVSSYVFTTVEGIFYNTFFNFLEHSGYALSGLLFALSFSQISKTYKKFSIDKGQSK